MKTILSSILLLLLAGAAHASGVNEKVQSAGHAASAAATKTENAVKRGAKKTDAAIKRSTDKAGAAINRGAKKIGLPTAASSPGAGAQEAK